MTFRDSALGAGTFFSVGVTRHDPLQHRACAQITGFARFEGQCISLVEPHRIEWIAGVAQIAEHALEILPDEMPEHEAVVQRGAPAHQWVERFFWYWFTSGFAASQSKGGRVHGPEDFDHLQYGSECSS